MRRLRWMIILGRAGGLALLVVGGLAAPSAGAPARAPRPVGLGAHFVRSGSGTVSNQGNWVTVTRGRTLALIDATTGHRTTITVPSDCRSQAISQAELLLDCGETLPITQTIEDIATRAVTPLQLNPECEEGPDTTCAAADIGSDWIEAVDECDAEHCGQELRRFQNRTTGQIVGDPTSSTVIPDLDSPGLAHALCAPVAVPTFTQPYSPPGFGTVQMDGRFAIATSDGGTYLEECGVKLYRHLSFSGVVFNRHAVLWQHKPGQLTGLFLPSLTPFTIAIPRKVDPDVALAQSDRDDEYQLAVSERTLYVEKSGRIWTTPMPARPPKAQRKARR